MITLLRFIDSGAYHARTYTDIAHTDRNTLETAVIHKLVTHGKHGYTLTVDGFYKAWPEFSSGDRSC